MSWSRERKRQRRNKIKAIAYLGGHCMSCGGVFHPACFDFHHTDPTQKDYKPTKLFRLGWDKIEEELQKMELLCAHCHRMHHYELEELV